MKTTIVVVLASPVSIIPKSSVENVRHLSRNQNRQQQLPGDQNMVIKNPPRGLRS